MSAYMYTYNAQQITKKTVTTTKTYDEEGRLITEETYEEIEYAPVASQPGIVLPQPQVAPNTPWIINAANTQLDQHVRLTGDAKMSDRKPLDLDPPTVDEYWGS